MYKNREGGGGGRGTSRRSCLHLLSYGHVISIEENHQQIDASKRDKTEKVRKGCRLFAVEVANQVRWSHDEDGQRAGVNQPDYVDAGCCNHNLFCRFCSYHTDNHTTPPHHPGSLPDIQQHQLSRALYIRLICQLAEEVGERRGKAAAAAAGGRAEEEQEDPVLQAAEQLRLRVQLVPLPVVLHQDAVHKQVHHGGQVGGRAGTGSGF